MKPANSCSRRREETTSLQRKRHEANELVPKRWRTSAPQDACAIFWHTRNSARFWSAAALRRFSVRWQADHNLPNRNALPRRYFAMRDGYTAFVAGFVCFLLLHASAAIPVPAQKEFTNSLNGKWRFKLEQAPAPPRFLGVSGRPIPIEYPATLEPFYKPDYKEDSKWHDLAVPGNWEMAGFSPATYNQPDNASGFYRTHFRVPASWKDRIVKIHFDGVQNGCEVWCNGQPVPVSQCSWGRTNYHECGWTAWEADVSSAIKFGAANLLALRVTKNTKGVDCDTGDFFLLGGVHRPVTLFSVPRTHVKNFSVRTKLLDNDAAEVSVAVELDGARGGESVVAKLAGEHPMQGNADQDGRVTLSQTVYHPKLWSAEWPNLYDFSLELRDASAKASERLVRRIGIREVSITNGVFCVNKVPVKLVGICRHDVYPSLGTAITPKVWKKDLTLMKEANFNAVRTSHYPYGPGFYDLCDEMGFYVLDEEPFCWVDCDKPELMPAFEQRSRETVERDINHPCVVIWGVGNENKPGRNNTKAALITRELDPTRPRLISCQKAEDGGANVEFDDAHYITPEQIHKAELSKRRATIPMIYTENPNVWEARNATDYGSLDLWAEVIDRTWRELWNDDHVCGTFLWEWQDRAVADKYKKKYYYFFPETGINLVKVKGLVDGFRNPRPDLFHCKMAQSPIGLSQSPELGNDSITIAITNRYSFTDLEALNVTWSLHRGADVISSGVTHIALPPRSHDRVKLSLPMATLANAETLQLQFDHPQGWNVLTENLQLKPASHPAPKFKPLENLRFPEFDLITGTKINDGKGWHKMDYQTGMLANVTLTLKNGSERTSPNLREMRFGDVRSLDADVMLGSTNIARLHAGNANGNLSYRLTWKGPKADVYELGWKFHMPKGAARFSWDRHAKWSYYPPKHIGRPEGTAVPDTARAQLTRWDRPDAFDFDTTKFNCNWASMKEGNGSGLTVLFAPDQRHHCRGDLASDGSSALTVNRCFSPPPDISTKIVPDLYTHLKKKDEISGSFKVE